METLSQCHSEEPFGRAQDKLRDEESACFSVSKGSKTIKQILHCVRLCENSSFANSVRLLLKHRSKKPRSLELKNDFFGFVEAKR
jgi:hypothetical protein